MIRLDALIGRKLTAKEFGVVAVLTVGVFVALLLKYGPPLNPPAREGGSMLDALDKPTLVKFDGTPHVRMRVGNLSSYDFHEVRPDGTIRIGPKVFRVERSSLVEQEIAVNLVEVVPTNSPVFPAVPSQTVKNR